MPDGGLGVGEHNGDRRRSVQDRDVVAAAQRYGRLFQLGHQFSAPELAVLSFHCGHLISPNESAPAVGYIAPSPEVAMWKTRFSLVRPNMLPVLDDDRSSGVPAIDTLVRRSGPIDGGNR
ncbi:hypothetical protein [Lentzea sp. NPDC004782]|uniref:hypothetical protein n=1 Tax=Lentzea sp. NPDC004782 TaxID=3154458 RepID=UPI0033A91E57